MEVILLQRVEKLGKMGEIVNVRPGYARNFLLPKKVALRATKENIDHFNKEKEALEAVNEKHMKDAESLAKKLDGKSVTLIRQASEGGQLYGSVTPRDIADVCAEDHIKRGDIRIDHPIKTLGIHAVRIQLHPEVSVILSVNVAMSEDEAKAQAETLEQVKAATSDAD